MVCIFYWGPVIQVSFLMYTPVKCLYSWFYTINAECNLVCYVHQSLSITIVVHSVFQAFYLSCHFFIGYNNEFGFSFVHTWKWYDFISQVNWPSWFWIIVHYHTLISNKITERLQLVCFSKLSLYRLIYTS